MTTLLDLVKHYQRIIEKHPQDEQKVLKAIDKLFNLDVTVQHLQETGVGRTVNALRKEPEMVGKAARALVYKWKLMVANEESDQEEDHNDISTQNGSGKDSDDGQHSLSRSHKDYKQMNGDHSGSKRKYHSSEEEGPDTKMSRHSHSSESEDHKRKLLQPKTEPESDSQSSDSHSESDSESESSEEERKPVKIKTEPKDKPSNSKYATTSHSKHTTSESSSSKRSHESAEQNSSKHSKHNSESRHSSDKSSKSAHSSRDKEQSSDKKHSSEKYHKTDKEKSKERVESKPSIKNSSEKYKSSSHKTDSSSDRYKEQEKTKTEYSSSRSDKEKHKSSSEKEDKQKSKESSSLKEKSSSSKDRTKDRSSSSKEKAKSSSSSHSKSEKKQSTSSDKSDKSKSESKSKSDKSEETSSEKKSSHKSSSSHKHSSSSSKSKEYKPKKNVTINTDSDEDGIGCESGASFAEALGMVLPTKSKKKQSTTPIKDAFSPNTTGNDLSPLSLLNPHARLAPLPALEISALPDISPNYKPRPPPKCIPHFTEEELGAAITSKNLRTKVYSGNKIVGKIPSLYDMCVQVLQEHIDALEYTGGVPYEILKPVVDKATPQQLFMLEHYNPYLMEDTDHLWQKHCEKLFRNKKRQEMETWREMFMRCQEEQENKLKSLTANIKLTQEAKKAPIKQTKMAYVDSVVKPPRNVARKQAQHGTAHAATASPAARVASLAAQPNVLRGGIRAPPAPPTSASSFNKPKKAPLMAKALQLMRGRKR